MKVLIYIDWAIKAWNIPLPHVAQLRQRLPKITFVHALNEAEALQDIVDADVCFSPRLAAALLEPARRLRWVHSSAAAVEGLLPLADLDRRGIVVSNSKGIQATPMAEHVMGGLLVLARRLDLTLAAQRQKEWIQAQLCQTDWPWTLRGKSMTIVGLGSIGQEVARRADAFGIRVTGVRQHPNLPKPSFVDRVVGPKHLDDALAGCDILVISAPFVARTNRIIGAEQLARLNPGAVLVNVARGQIVDEPAMIDALKSGQLGGAVLDVFEREPLDTSSPLWSLPNVVITPHSSGFRASHWDDVIDLFCENLRRDSSGEPLLNLVDCNAGY